MSDPGAMSTDRRTSSPPGPSPSEALAITTTVPKWATVPPMDGAALRADLDRIIDPTL